MNLEVIIFVIWKSLNVTSDGCSVREVQGSNAGQGDLQRKFIFLTLPPQYPSKCVG